MGERLQRMTDDEIDAAIFDIMTSGRIWPWLTTEDNRKELDYLSLLQRERDRRRRIRW